MRALGLDRPFSFGASRSCRFARRTTRGVVRVPIEGADGDVVGYATTPASSPTAHEALSDARVLAIEANHDAKMLREGLTPTRSSAASAAIWGHLSNDQAAVELERLLTSRLECVVGMHLSENNNLPRWRAARREVLGRNAHGRSLKRPPSTCFLSVR